MLTDSKKCKLMFQIMSIACVVAIAACLIVDIVINKRTVWSGYPIFSILLAWGIAAPLLMAKKHKVLISMGFTSIAIFPFLFLLERLTPMKGWFVQLGVPIAVIAIIAIWITYFVFRFLKINKWYFAAILIIIYGIGVSNGVIFITSRFLNTDFITLDSTINFIACVAVSVLCVIVGYNREQNKKLRENMKGMQ